MRFGMTFSAGLAVALAVSACSAEPAGSDGATQVQTDGEMAGTPREPAIAAGSVELRGDGLAVTGAMGTSLAFTSPRDEAEREIAAALGAALDSSTNGECGAGPMAMTRYAGGLTLNFQDAKLVGWFFDGEGDAPRPIQMTGGLTVGSDAEVAENMLAAQPVENSTLGEEFFSEDGIGGFVESEQDVRRVSALYAGTNCFFR